MWRVEMEGPSGSGWETAWTGKRYEERDFHKIYSVVIRKPDGSKLPGLFTTRRPHNKYSKADEADLRRVVAALNYCEGMTVEELEAKYA